MRTLLNCVGIAVSSVVVTLLLSGLYGIIADSRERAGPEKVSFSELLAKIDTGGVEEIRINGGVYTFRTSPAFGKPGFTRRAIGPKATSTDESALRPTDPSLPAPKIIFE